MHVLLGPVDMPQYWSSSDLVSIYCEDDRKSHKFVKSCLQNALSHIAHKPEGLSQNAVTALRLGK